MFWILFYKGYVGSSFMIFYDHLCWPEFCNCNFIKKETLTRLFSCKFCEIFKNTFFYRTPLVVLSVINPSNFFFYRVLCRVSFYCLVHCLVHFTAFLSLFSIFHRSGRRKTVAEAYSEPSQTSTVEFTLQKQLQMFDWILNTPLCTFTIFASFHVNLILFWIHLIKSTSYIVTLFCTLTMIKKHLLLMRSFVDWSKRGNFELFMNQEYEWPVIVVATIRVIDLLYVNVMMLLCYFCYNDKIKFFLCFTPSFSIKLKL